MNQQSFDFDGVDPIGVIDNDQLRNSSLRVSEDRFWTNNLGGYSTSGETVTERKAFGLATVNQAITILSSDTAQVPIRLMKTDGAGNSEIWCDSQLDYIVSHRPNRFQTPSVFYETLMKDCLFYGNGLAHIVRDSGGRVQELIPLPPRYTWIVQPHDRLNPMIRTRYAYNYEEMILGESEIIHIRGLCEDSDYGLDGWWGASMLEYAVNALGYSLTLEKHGASTFKNGARPGLLVKPAGKLNKEAARNLREAMYQVHGGAGNANRTGILPQSTEVQEINSQSNIDAQWLDARKLDREHIASLFNLPAYKLNSLDNSSTRANLEEQNRDYWNSSLSRWLNRFVEEFGVKLLGTRPREKEYFRAFPETFLRGDQATRFANYETAIGSRFMTPNEARKAEGMNPLEGGDELLNPAIDTIDRNQQDEPEQSDEPDDQEDQQLENLSDHGFHRNGFTNGNSHARSLH